MKVTLRKQEILDLDEGLRGLGRIKGDIRFNYGVAKNKRLVKTEIETLEELSKPTDDFVKYEKDRISLVEKLAAKDEGGAPKIVKIPQARPDGQVIYTSRYDVDENDPKFKAEIKKLKTKYKAAIEGQKKHEEEFEGILKTEVEVELHLIPLSIVPEMEESLFDKIYPIIHDDLDLASAEEAESQED